jgi:integrase
MARPVGQPPHQIPYRRVYPDARFVWVARYVDLSGRARYAKPRWHGYKATFARRADAQKAIDEELERLRGAQLPRRLGEYFLTWLDRHPRSSRTNETDANRIASVLGVEIDGRPLAEWEFDELRRRHALELLSHLLEVGGRAARGAKGILSAYSAMAEDAIGDEAATHNAFAGVRVCATDPRVKKPPRRTRIWTFQQMLAFARGGRAEVRAATRRPEAKSESARGTRRARFYSACDYEAMILTPGFTGLRLGEVFALRDEDYDGRTFHLSHTAHEGVLIPSSEQKNHERSVPVPRTLVELISRREPTDSEFLFPTATGRLWRAQNFYRDVWTPAKLVTGLDPTPHELRHSYVSNLRAAGIDDADLASVAGQRVETMVSVYTHALQRSHEAIREVIG